MAGVNGIRALILDVNGTIFSVEDAAKPVFKDLGIDENLISVNPRLLERPTTILPKGHSLTAVTPIGPPLLAPQYFLQLWFAQVLRDAVCAQLSGVFVPFKCFAGHHLTNLASLSSTHDTPLPFTADDAAGKLTAAMKEAKPFPDVGPALTKLELAGVKIAALTNGSIPIARAVLERAGISDAAIFDINEPKAWKPDVNAYRFATNSLLLRPEEVMMVAAHPWDCHGALQAGLRACYVQRTEHERYPEFLDQPELTVASFEELARVLLD